MDVTFYENTWSEVWAKLRDVPFRTSKNGVIKVKPYTQSNAADYEISVRCRKKIDDYKIMTFKTWNGNGMGHTSVLFLWNTATGEMKSLLGCGSYSFILKRVIAYHVQENS